MEKPVLSRSVIFVLGLAGLASAQFKYWDPADPSQAPALISATGLYPNLPARKTLLASAVYYDVNAALWSDGSAKRRWVLLKPGTAITFDEKGDYWGYPDSTVFIKDFAIDTVAGDTTTRVLYETRLLILKKEATDPGNPARLDDKWYGFSYKWRKDQKEADLVPDTGLKTSIRWYPKGKSQPSALKKWFFPSRRQCLACHNSDAQDTLHGRTVLGFFTAQLNMPSPLNPGTNQLEDFFTHRKILKGDRPADFTRSPKWVGLDAVDAQDPKLLEKKAYSYIAANCSGCHGARGNALGITQVDHLDFDFHTGVSPMQFAYKEVSKSFGLDKPGEPADDPFKGVYLVNPGHPGKSVLLYRQTVRNRMAPDSVLAYDSERDQMPPLATYEVNAEAIAVLTQWIESLPQTGSAVRPGSRQALLSPTFSGRTLRLPPGLMKDEARVSMTDLRGRNQELKKVGRGLYAIPASLPAGLYIIRVGALNFTRYLL
jgi:hypothetical protein